MKPLLSVVVLCLVANAVEAKIEGSVSKDGTVNLSFALPQIGGICANHTSSDNSNTLVGGSFFLDLLCRKSNTETPTETPAETPGDAGTPGLIGKLFNFLDMDNPDVTGPTASASSTGSAGLGGLMDMLTSKSGPLAEILKLVKSGAGGITGTIKNLLDGLMKAVKSGTGGIVNALKSGDGGYNGTYSSGPLADLLAKLGSGGNDGVLGGISGPRGLGGLLNILGSKGGIMGLLDSRGEGGIMDILTSKTGPLKGIMDMLASKTGPLKGLMNLLGSGNDGIMKLLGSGKDGIMKLLGSGGDGGLMSLLTSKSGPLAGIFKLLGNSGGSIGGNVNMTGDYNFLPGTIDKVSSGLFMKVMGLLNKLLSPIFGIISDATSKSINPKTIHDLTSGILGTPNGTLPGSRLPKSMLPNFNLKIDAGMGKHQTHFNAGFGGDDIPDDEE